MEFSTKSQFEITIQQLIRKVIKIVFDGFIFLNFNLMDEVFRAFLSFPLWPCAIMFAGRLVVSEPKIQPLTLRQHAIHLFATQWH